MKKTTEVTFEISQEEIMKVLTKHFRTEIFEKENVSPNQRCEIDLFAETHPENEMIVSGTLIAKISYTKEEAI